MRDHAMEMRKADLHDHIRMAQQLFQRLIDPYIRELAHIASCQRPETIGLDGKKYVYTGPMPEWKGPWDDNNRPPTILDRLDFCIERPGNRPGPKPDGDAKSQVPDAGAAGRLDDGPGVR